MKKNILILMLVFVSDFGFSQKRLTRFLPVLFDTVKVDLNYKRKRLEIKDPLLSDSLKFLVKVVVEFKYPLNNITKRIIVKSVRLIDLEAKSLSKKEQGFIDFSERKKLPKCQRNVWNRYSRIFNYWYRHQPYEKMIDRKAYGNKVCFGAVFYVMPR